MKISEQQVAWAAGLLEGEGCFSLHKRKDRPGTFSCAIHCEMTDEDTVQSLQKVFGVGTVCTRANRMNRKPTYIWSVQRHQDIFDVLLHVLPFLKERRKEKAKELFTFLEEKVVC